MREIPKKREFGKNGIGGILIATKQILLPFLESLVGVFTSTKFFVSVSGFFATLAAFLLVFNVFAMGHPTSADCVNSGLGLKMVDTSAAQSGICHFKNGKVCEERAFYGGECGGDPRQSSSHHSKQLPSNLSTHLGTSLGYSLSGGGSQSGQIGI